MDEPPKLENAEPRKKNGEVSHDISMEVFGGSDAQLWAGGCRGEPSAREEVQGASAPARGEESCTNLARTKLSYKWSKALQHSTKDYQRDKKKPGRLQRSIGSSSDDHP